MSTSETDCSNDLTDPDLGNIKLIINVTRENIDSLNKKFGEQVNPPPIYVLEYEELTSKLHDLKLKQLKLENMLHQQRQVCSPVNRIPEIGSSNIEASDVGHTESVLVVKTTEVNDMVSGKNETNTNNSPRAEMNNKQNSIQLQAKETLADAAEDFTSFASSVDTNYCTDKVSDVIIGLYIF